MVSIDLVGISPRAMEYCLHVILIAISIKQKMRHFDPNKNKIIQEEVQKLLVVDHIQEVYFPSWLFNVVLVPKSSGKWQMCVDF